MTDILNALALLANYVIVPGLAYGSQLALGALGATLVFGILRFSNFAHGDMMAFGTMITVLVTWWLQAVGVSISPLPTALLALPVGIVVTAALAVLTDKAIYRYYRQQKSRPITFVIASVGVMFIMNGLVRFIIGPGDQNFNDGERFIFTAREFRAVTGLAVARPDHCGRPGGRGGIVLVPAKDPHRQINARLLRQRRSGAALGHQP